MRTASSDEQETERERCEHWRYDVLVHAGWDVEAAELLAEHDYIDLHVAVDLLRRGCDQVTALRILL